MNLTLTARCHTQPKPNPRNQQVVQKEDEALSSMEAEYTRFKQKHAQMVEDQARSSMNVPCMKGNGTTRTYAWCAVRSPYSYAVHLPSVYLFPDGCQMGVRCVSAMCPMGVR